MSLRSRNRSLINVLKAEPCTDCHLTYPSEVMEFDHVTQAKLGNISELLDFSTEQLLAEISRCELVCANCHRQRTALRRTEAHLALADDADLRFEDEQAQG